MDLSAPSKATPSPIIRTNLNHKRFSHRLWGGDDGICLKVLGSPQNIQSLVEKPSQTAILVIYAMVYHGIPWYTPFPEKSVHSTE